MIFNWVKTVFNDNYLPKLFCLLLYSFLQCSALIPYIKELQKSHIRVIAFVLSLFTISSHGYFKVHVFKVFSKTLDPVCLELLSISKLSIISFIIDLAAKRPGLTQLSISCLIISDGSNFGWLK